MGPLKQCCSGIVSALHPRMTVKDWQTRSIERQCNASTERMKEYWRVVNSLMIRRVRGRKILISHHAATMIGIVINVRAD